MKQLLLLAFVFLTIQPVFSQNENENTTSTYYFIRHAEKDRSDLSNRNPHLIEIGKQRAEHWSNVLKNIEFDAVYSTEYHRTIETASPTALKNNIEITFYDPSNIENREFLNSTKGKSVLVVGHSNTTPDFVNKLLGKEKYKHIDDSNNANLYIVTIFKDTISDTLLLVE